MAKSRPPTTGSLSQYLFLALGVLSTATLAAPPALPPIPTITPPPTLLVPRQNDPQIQSLSQQLSALSQSSREISQSSQQLSITSAQLLNSVQQLSSRLTQTEQSVNALRQSVNNAEQASRSLSQQVAEVSRSADRQMSERLQRASMTMVENMSAMSVQMESSFSRRLAQASRSAVALAQGRVVQEGEDGGLETGFGVPTSTAVPEPVQGMRTEVVIGAVVGGVGVNGVECGGGCFWVEDTAATAEAGENKEKDVGKRVSDVSSVYSSDLDDDEKGLLKQQQQPSPATLARNAPDLRRMVLERSGTTISRKSVGGPKVGFAMSYYSPDSTTMPPPPKAVGTGVIKKAGEHNGNDNNSVMKVMTPTATTIVKTGGNKTRQMMKGFQLSQPPPGKLSLFPRSDGGSSGGSSPVDEEDGKGTPKRLESWLRRERGVVSPFATAAPGKK
ncbi:hypothetical protein QC764_307840 [Podospora pseudoanserina]|uniref:Uncharacterized protein n=1 Tax=Podospora pseudoanserina TaxID=2609844 RepID=A0ABR0IDL2_9PEZI|nr:hypothetical protein QC764_307840 [Podospora pseudoanserina]